MSASSSPRVTVQKPSVSVVIIARNEEANIARCIESVLQEIGDLGPEIILVDSASTDRTVEIASRYPITILQLSPVAGLSPSAGRFVGCRHASGEFILFLDADMVLIGGYVSAAIQSMVDPAIAAVGGRLFRVFPGEDLTRAHPEPDTLGRVGSLGGAGLYRAFALKASGGFNPFVKGEEERELGHRIASKGYAILRIDAPMVYHMEKHRTFSEVDEKTEYCQGLGQILRAYAGSEIAVSVLRSNAAAIVSALGFVGGVLFALLLVLFSGTAVRIAVVTAIASALLWYKVRGELWKLPLGARFRVLLLVNILVGWLRGIPDPATYEVSVSVVRHQAG